MSRASFVIRNWSVDSGFIRHSCFGFRALLLAALALKERNYLELAHVNQAAVGELEFGNDR
jgi:hypothetical protein